MDSTVWAPVIVWMVTSTPIIATILVMLDIQEKSYYIQLNFCICLFMYHWLYINILNELKCYNKGENSNDTIKIKKKCARAFEQMFFYLFLSWKMCYPFKGKSKTQIQEWQRNNLYSIGQIYLYVKLMSFS